MRFPDRMRFTAYLYLPNTVAVADYWNIWQTKTRFPDGSSDPVFIINGNGAVDPAGTWQGFELYQWRLQQRFGGFQIPVGRWVRVDVDYVWSGTNGSVMVRVRRRAGRRRLACPDGVPQRLQPLHAAPMVPEQLLAGAGHRRLHALLGQGASTVLGSPPEGDTFAVAVLPDGETDRLSPAPAATGGASVMPPCVGHRT